MSREVHRRPDSMQAASACAEDIYRLLHRALDNRPQATFAVSGGTAIKRLFPELVARHLTWDRIHLFWVDERGVPPSDEQSNFRLANELLVQPADIPDVNVHRIAAELPAPDAAARYVTEIRTVFQLGPNELPAFDVVHLGLGPDAHFASLFPGGALLADRTHIAAATYVEKLGQWRITLLAGVHLRASNAVFYVTGADKAEAVRSVFEASYEPERFPAQIMQREGRNVAWYVDEPAASLLPNKEP